MKAVFFDAGPVISLTMNNLLWILPKLKEHFDGEFCITQAVKNEVVDFPLTTKKFKFEAIQVLELIDNGVINVADTREIRDTTARMLGVANRVFSAHNHNINILQYAEVSILAAVKQFQSNTVVIDEKTTRLLSENPGKLRDILKKTLHTNISVNLDMLNEFKRFVKGINIIRSVEIAVISYELGVLDKYIYNTNFKHSSEQLLDAVLWGIKLKGCSVSENEIRRILKIESR